MTSCKSPSGLVSVEAIEACLPQIQCERCSYPGCAPYAAAIAAGEADINLCSPGGEPTMRALAALTGRPPMPVEAPTLQRYKAIIKESECIGCTKCIQICPVDAIIGAQGQMHTVLNSHCTGCELCIEACPMICISLEVVPGVPWIVEDGAANINFAQQSQVRALQRKNRISTELSTLAPNKVNDIQDLEKSSNKDSSLIQALVQTAQQNYKPKPFKIWNDDDAL